MHDRVAHITLAHGEQPGATGAWPRRAAAVVWLLLALVGGAAHATAASTVSDFDSPGTRYSVAHDGTNSALPTVTSGGPTGSFLRLATMPAVNLNTIAFDRTDVAANEITAAFDFRMVPPAAGRASAADGFGFALLKTEVYGPTGEMYASVPETPSFAGSLGVGFRIFNTNSVAITFNQVLLTTVDVTPWVDLASGEFIHAQIVMRPGDGFSDVTIVLTPTGGSPTTIVDRYHVPGFTPYAGRVWFGARSGGLSAQHDLDNINVQFAGVAPNLPFVDLLKGPCLKFVSYSPTNFDPNRDPSGALKKIPSAESITEDLVALRPGFNSLILYGTQTDDLPGGQQLVPWIVSEAKRLGFRAIVLGVYDPKDNAEVDAAAALVTQYGGDPGTFAVAVCIGNEGILRGEYGIPALDSARARLQSQLGALQIPIVTSEDLARYAAVPALKAWGTFLFPIIVPHWNRPDLGPVDAAAWVRGEGSRLADEAGVTVLVKEPGWPSGGAPLYPQYTPESQKQFFAAYQAGPRTVDSSLFPGVFTAYTTVLEAFDGYWKQSPDFTTWGLLGRDRAPKPAFSIFTDATCPCDPPTISGVVPQWGPVSGGSPVTIVGGCFRPGAIATFGGAGASDIVFVRPSAITATTPAHAPGAVDVVVTNPGSLAATKVNAFTYGATGFFTVPPCRVIDTRAASSALGGAIPANADRTYVIRRVCGVPATAGAISVNLTVTEPSADGHLRVYPGATPLPTVSSINYRAGQTRANNAVLSLGPGGTVAVRCVQASGSVHFILDVNGYFE